MVRKALVVEDDDKIGNLLVQHLQQAGFDPTLLGEGKPAVPWVREHHPELILLDLMLPDIDEGGFAVCENLKLEKETNLIPVIMITALTAQEDRIRGLTVGANRYLTKPFTASELKKAIDDVISWKDEIKGRGTHNEVQFQLQSDTNYLEELNDLLSALFLYGGMSDKQARQLMTAVRELVTNAIEWGHKKQIDRIVTVDYQVDSEKVTIHIRDTGPGFDPGNLPHAAKAEDPVSHMMVREALGIREGGFGIMMSEGLVDKMKYNETGNEVELIKFLSAPRRNGDGDGGSQ